MADLKSVVENFFDRMRGKTPVSQPEPTETAAPTVPPEGASQTEAAPAATGTPGRTGS